jgi:hypothetical protein
MEKNLTKIIDHLITTSDLVCFDNSKNGMDDNELNADILRLCLSQQSDEGRDKTAGGILKEHGLTVWDLKFLDEQGVLVDEEQADAPGSFIDDRTLHVQLKLDSVEKLASINVFKWQ